MRGLPVALIGLFLVAGAGCSGGSDSDGGRTETPGPASATPVGMREEDYWFRGVVREMNTGCYVDAICSVTVEVTNRLGGAELAMGTEVTIVESYGFSTRRCEGAWTETPPGQAVEVLAHATEDGGMAVCEGAHYFVRAAE